LYDEGRENRFCLHPNKTKQDTRDDDGDGIIDTKDTDDGDGDADGIIGSDDASKSQSRSLSQSQSE